MSEDDLVRFFRSVLGDTSRDGGACIPLHPSPPAFTSASRRDRACRDLDLPKTLCRESGFFATRHTLASRNRTLRFPVSESGKPVRPLRSTAPVRGPSRVDRRSLDVSPTGFGVRQSAVRGRESRSAF